MRFIKYFPGHNVTNSSFRDSIMGGIIFESVYVYYIETDLLIAENTAERHLAAE